MRSLLHPLAWALLCLGALFGIGLAGAVSLLVAPSGNCVRVQRDLDSLKTQQDVLQGLMNRHTNRLERTKADITRVLARRRRG